MSDTELTPEPENQEPSQRPPDARLQKGMSTAWRFIASGAGVIATIGGVIGVYQFLTSPASETPSLRSAEDMIVAMVDQDVISLEDASRIALALSGPVETGNAAAAESIQNIASAGSDNQRRAIQLMSQQETREEGLDLLKSEAETSEDWYTVALFSASIDDEVAFSAVRKSVALDPENFKSLTLLASLQLRQGDFADARRSVMTAGLLAQTPYEKLLAERASLEVATSSGNVPAIQEAIPGLESALTAYEMSVDMDAYPDAFALGAYRDHPVWISAMEHYRIASGYAYLDRQAASQAAASVAASGQDVDENVYLEAQLYADIIIAELEIVITGLEKLVPLSTEEDRLHITRNYLGALSRVADAYFSKGELERGGAYSARMLEAARIEAESGNRGAIEELASYYSQHAGNLYRAKDYASGKRALRRATDLRAKYARDHETTEDLPLELAALELDYAAGIAFYGDGESLEEAANTYMSLLEGRILLSAQDGDGDEEEAGDQLRAYMTKGYELASIYAAATSSIRSADKAIASINRPLEFNRALMKEFGPNHDRLHGDFDLLALQGDIYFNLLNKDAALASYQEAYDVASDITPVEDEEDIVELCQLHALSRIGFLEMDVSDQAVRDAIALGARLDKEGRLSTGHQNFYNQALGMAQSRGLITP